MHKIIIIIILFSINCIGFSQLHSEESFYDIAKPKESGEEIILETDRQFYCVDERIYFAARYKFNQTMDDVHWSSVLYVELIKWNGGKIAQAKFRLFENSASGYLTIPNTLESGNYYIRAYTKWMRNFPVENYCYKLLKVINPFESKIDIGPTQEADELLVPSIPSKANLYNDIECFTDKSTFEQREKVDLTLLLKNHDYDDSHFCISVAKTAYLDTNNYFIQIPDKISPDNNTLTYLPEIRGISISGKILNANTRISLANTTLHLSTLQNWKYFSTFHTKDNGKFYFTFPLSFGQYDFYLDAELENGERAEILIDNDYCNRSIHLTYIPFSLDHREKEIALEMAVNMQLSNAYNEESGMPPPDSTHLPFYGYPKHVYYTREYVELPNLEDFFYELVKEVRTIKVNKQTDLKLVAYNQYHDLKPLILLDNTSVLNVSEFLKTPLEKIEKIEIFDSPYIVSGRRYSGIICASSKNNDFAGINLNQNSLFFSYNLLSEGNYMMTDYGSDNANRYTYRQNLLFWDPDIELNLDYPETISFYTSDSKGEYIVFIRSINAKGKPQLYGTCKIVVE